MYKQLVVISDTAIYKNDGKVFGFASVVQELEYIEDKFETIIWIGTNSPKLKGNDTLIEIKSQNIQTILIPKMGGKSIFQILKILVLYPYLFLLIGKHIFNASVIHTRAPSHPAFIAILLSFLIPKKIWWHKFAGSWKSSNLPLFYKLQRNILEKAKHSNVTINGFWPNQPNHCISFENPCLTNEDINRGIEIIKTKKFTDKFNLCFIGRLDEAKGVDLIIEALKQINLDKIEKIYFIGDGERRKHFQYQAAFLEGKAVFYGFLNKQRVHHILSTSHFLLLPSKSEGFPKVIAEAACYGVIPIASDVGSISHYINQSNGFIWKYNGAQSFATVLNQAFETNPDQLAQISQNVLPLAELFTFENYRSKLQQYILNSTATEQDNN